MKKMISKMLISIAMLTNLSASDIKVGDIINVELTHIVEIPYRENWSVFPIVFNVENGCKMVANLEATSFMVNAKDIVYFCNDKIERIHGYIVSPKNNKTGLLFSYGKSKNVLVQAQKANIYIYGVSEDIEETKNNVEIK
jgi:hypothetical protein